MSGAIVFNCFFVIGQFAIFCCFVLTNPLFVHGQGSLRDLPKVQPVQPPNSKALLDNSHRRTGNPLIDLLLVEEVRSELKIDSSQERELNDAISAILEARNQLAAKAQTLRERDKAQMDTAVAEIASTLAMSSNKLSTSLEEILDPVQMDRLLGIYIQQNGGLALCNSIVTKRLAISSDQSKLIMKVAINQGRQEFAFNAPNALEAINLRRKGMEDQMVAVLTDIQKRLFAELRGEKFEFRQNKLLNLSK